jgi:hypothetical protein
MIKGFLYYKDQNGSYITKIKMVLILQKSKAVSQSAELFLYYTIQRLFHSQRSCSYIAKIKGCFTVSGAVLILQKSKAVSQSAELFLYYKNQRLFHSQRSCSYIAKIKGFLYYITIEGILI